MADAYWIDIVPPRGAYGSVGHVYDLIPHVGADAYDIVPRLAGPHHHRHHNGRPLFYTVDYGVTPIVVSPDAYDIPDNVAWPGFIDNAVKYVGHVGKDIIHTANHAAKYAGRAISSAGKAVGQIPVVGKPLRATLNLNPFVAVGGLVSKVASGERLDRAFLESAKNRIAAAREVAPYVSMVTSVVPGIGSGVAASIAAGVALSEGRTITDVVLEAAKNAAPGGALGKIAMGAALDIAKGNSITTAAMNQALAQLPPNVRSAANVAIQAARGQNVRVAVLKAIHANLPSEAKKALEIGNALAVARNIQSHVVNTLVKPGGIAMLERAAVPEVFKRAMPSSSEQAAGYKAAINLLQHTGVTAHAIAAARSTMPKIKQVGYDQGLKAYVNHFTPHHTSLVRGGLVTRGNWRKVSASEKGAVPGRLIENGKITFGHYVRS